MINKHTRPWEKKGSTFNSRGNWNFPYPIHISFILPVWSWEKRDTPSVSGTGSPGGFCSNYKIKWELENHLLTLHYIKWIWFIILKIWDHHVGCQCTYVMITQTQTSLLHYRTKENEHSSSSLDTLPFPVWKFHQIPFNSLKKKLQISTKARQTAWSLYTSNFSSWSIIKY